MTNERLREIDKWRMKANSEMAADFWAENYAKDTLDLTEALEAVKKERDEAIRRERDGLCDSHIPSCHVYAQEVQKERDVALVLLRDKDPNKLRNDPAERMAEEALAKKIIAKTSHDPRCPCPWHNE